MELGVPKGEMFATLKGGKSVTLEDGSVVEPHLVSFFVSKSSCESSMCVCTSEFADLETLQCWRASPPGPKLSVLCTGCRSGVGDSYSSSHLPCRMICSKGKRAMRECRARHSL